jgi:dipeptide/tripeptide permease
MSTIGTAPGATVSGLPTQRTFLGHPIGLYVLFFTEMWERFSYYGMRALLILYMINYFKWSQKDASTIYKVYTSFVYVTPILGGYLADRVLGNRRAVIIGALLMAVGHFLMAFEEFPVFLAALIFLIFGNGFFKPNMSTQVGRLYPTNDGRRDGAYTIFYMGINLGAFLSPIVCGWLAANTVGGYHTGFTMAGIGMVCGLVIYLVGQPLIQEIDPSVIAPTRHPTDAAPSNQSAATGETQSKADRPLTEAEAQAAPSIFGALSGLVPSSLTLLGIFTSLFGVVLSAFALPKTGLDINQLPEWLRLSFWDALMVVIVGVCLVLMGFVAKQVRGGLRDRVIAILTLGVFVVFFWAAFEQAGNVLNVWADKNTNRYLTRLAPDEAVIPEVVEDSAAADTTQQTAESNGIVARYRTMFTLKSKPESKAETGWWEWLLDAVNPLSAEAFQSVNALAIFVFAPLFAFMWVILDRRGWQPSIPLKMTIGLVMMSASMAVMLIAAKQEDKQSTVQVHGKPMLPREITVNDGGQIARRSKGGIGELFHAGRITFDPQSGKLSLFGVLPDTERDNLIEETAPEEFKKQVKELVTESEKIDKDHPSVSVRIGDVPPGFDLKYAGLSKKVVRFDPEARTLTAFKQLREKESKGLLIAAGEPDFRTSMHELYIQSTHLRVSPLWLVWSYIFATFGELCLSPVGLSMVSKLAPAKFATMLMGVWMLTSAFGNFAAGLLGEIWGTIPPVQFFMLSTVVVGGAAVVLLFLVRLVVKTMHGVN